MSRSRHPGPKRWHSHLRSLGWRIPRPSRDIRRDEPKDEKVVVERVRVAPSLRGYPQSIDRFDYDEWYPTLDELNYDDLSCTCCSDLDYSDHDHYMDNSAARALTRALTHTDKEHYDPPYSRDRY